MIEIPFLIALSLTLFAGIYDLKTSNVFEEIPALMISLGLFYWFIISLISANLQYFINSLLIGLFFLSFGLILFKLKMWGDGDAWILGGIGFLVPYLPTLKLYPFFFLIFLFVIGSIYSLIYIFAYGLFKRSVRHSFILEFKKHKNLYLGFLAISITLSFYSHIILLIGFLPIIYFYAKSVEKNMKKRIKVSDLKEGDVLAGREIVGVSKEEINNLKKKKKYVEIQEGVRFTIVFPITIVFVYYFNFILSLFI